MKVSLLRGTKDFILETSDLGNEWSTIANGTLADVRNRNCEEIYYESIDGRFVARLFRFVPLSFYGKGAGLQHFGYDFAESFILVD